MATQNEVIFHAGVETQSFYDNLKKVSNTFKKWRYIHQQEAGTHSVNEEFLLLLNTGIQRTALNQRNLTLPSSGRAFGTPLK